MAEAKTEVVAQPKADLTDIAIDNSFINGLCEQLKQKEKYGLTFPKDYNYTNALTGAYLTLLQTKDKNQQPALKVCTKTSIAQAFMNLATLGLDTQKKQAYFVAYGSELQLQQSYFGKQAIARRYGAKDFNPQVIYEGDEFSYEIVNGKKTNMAHKQDFTNIDITKIKGAYVVVEFQDGSLHLEVMNMLQIEAAWKQGYGYKKDGNGTHQKFTDQMCMKTVINRACKNIIQTHGDEALVEVYEDLETHEQDDRTFLDMQNDVSQNANSVDFEDLTGETAEKVSGEVVEDEPKKETKKKDSEHQESKPTPDWGK